MRLENRFQVCYLWGGGGDSIARTPQIPPNFAPATVERLQVGSWARVLVCDPSLGKRRLLVRVVLGKTWVSLVKRAPPPKKKQKHPLKKEEEKETNKLPGRQVPDTESIYRTYPIPMYTFHWHYAITYQYIRLSVEVLLEGCATSRFRHSPWIPVTILTHGVDCIIPCGFTWTIDHHLWLDFRAGDPYCGLLLSNQLQNELRLGALRPQGSKVSRLPGAWHW